MCTVVDRSASNTGSRSLPEVVLELLQQDPVAPQQRGRLVLRGVTQQPPMSPAVSHTSRSHPRSHPLAWQAEHCGVDPARAGAQDVDPHDLVEQVEQAPVERDEVAVRALLLVRVVGPRLRRRARLLVEQFSARTPPIARLTPPVIAVAKRISCVAA